MSTHHVTCAPIAILGALLVVTSQAFSSHTLGWVAFGVAIGIVAIILMAQLDRARGRVQRALDAAMFVVGGLLIAFAIAASGSAIVWLAFAFGLGEAALGFTGLTLHEIASWRSLHRLPEIRWLHEGDDATFPSQARAA